MRISHFSYLCIPILAVACGESEFAGSDSKKRDSDASSSYFVTETFAELTRGVDVVIGIDSSGSMIEEQQALEKNLSKFVKDLENHKLGARVTVVGSPSFQMPPDAPADQFAVVNRKIGSHDAIRVLTDFFRSGANPLPFRDGAGLEVIIITDDNAMNYSGFRAEDFRSPEGKEAVVNSIVGLPESKESETCKIVATGDEYMKLTQTTGGTILDLCEENWDNMVSQLATGIINRNSGFPLKDIPDLTKEITVWVDDQPVAPENYKIDVEAKTITFTKEIALSPDSVVKISYYTTKKT